jgi:UDP:flavonoid glycosyltransferase YjiC (YdhE family)
VAARVHWAGVGIDLHTGKPSPTKIAKAVRRILAQPSYAENSKRVQAEIAASHPIETITATLVALAEQRATPAA